MGVGEYDANFYSKMMNNAKVVDENNEDYDEGDDEKEDDLKNMN